MLLNKPEEPGKKLNTIFTSRASAYAEIADMHEMCFVVFAVAEKILRKSPKVFLF
jgi:hypothetical protein